MLFQFEMAALLGDSDAGEKEREKERKGESGRYSEREKGGCEEKKKARRKMVVWNIC